MTLIGRPSEEVPFGINALVEDTEVDGVWNSKASTPFHGKRQKTHSNSTVRPNFSLKKAKKNPSVSSASSVGIADTGVASPEGTRPTTRLPSLLLIHPTELTPFTCHFQDADTTIEHKVLNMGVDTPIINYQGPYLAGEVGEGFPGMTNSALVFHKSCLILTM